MLFEIYRHKTVLITGDTGFKGSWLAIWLLNLGAEVYGYGLPATNQKDNYVICGLPEKYEHIDGDIRDYQHVNQVIKKVNPEFIFHFAAQPLVLESYENPLYTFETNINGTLNLLEAIRNTGNTKVLINITSDKCYENREWVYKYRETDRLGGKDPYSASKVCSEVITRAYYDSFLSNITHTATARAGNVIGGGDWSKYRIVPDCIGSLLNEKPIIVRNPGSVRPWQHVLEVLYGYLKLGEKLYKYGTEFTGAWNFGTFNESLINVEALVEKIIRYWGKGEYIIRSDIGNKEANILSLDISKSVNLLKWKPVFNFEQMISNTVNEYQASDNIFEHRIKQINNYCELLKNG